MKRARKAVHPEWHRVRALLRDAARGDEEAYKALKARGYPETWVRLLMAWEKARERERADEEDSARYTMESDVLDHDLRGRGSEE